MTLEKLKEDEKFINMIFDWGELVRNNDFKLWAHTVYKGKNSLHRYNDGSNCLFLL